MTGRDHDRTGYGVLQHEVSLDEDPELSAGYPEGIPNRIVVTRADGTQFVLEVRPRWRQVVLVTMYKTKND